jgi:hypothetical protein
LIRKIIAICVLLLAACSQKESKPLSADESAEVQAAAYDFQVYPGSQFLPQLTDLFRRAHFVLQPGATAAPPMAAYQTDASVREVAEFYAKTYGYEAVAEDPSKATTYGAPKAYYRSGDVRADAEGGKELYAKLNLTPDFSKASGNYEGAHISATPRYPRVTVQRPYFDLQQSRMVDKTLILMVKE